MKLTRTHVTPAWASAIAATFLTANIAHAEDAPSRTGLCETEAIYEGVDDSGRVLNLTLSDVRVDSWRRLSNPASDAEPHWTAFIGTGGARDEKAKADRK